MLPGMDTFKEKLVWGYGDKMLERGFAALAIDGPGQSEPLMHGLRVTADNFADAGRACIAWIDTRKDLDQTRIGVFGRSFGSYAASPVQRNCRSPSWGRGRPALFRTGLDQNFRRGIADLQKSLYVHGWL
jgi:hypothetical protein